MIFEVLDDAARRDELLLMDSGLCHWHLRQDGQITIHEILVLPARRNQGIGKAMLAYLKCVPNATSIFAKCPRDLKANGWYRRVGFQDEGLEQTKTGRWLRLWRFRL